MRIPRDTPTKYPVIYQERNPEWNSGCKIIVTYTYYCIMSPTNEGEEGHIAFGEDPVDVRVASCLRSYLLNQWVDFHQTVIDTLLGRGKEEIRFW